MAVTCAGLFAVLAIAVGLRWTPLLRVDRGVAVRTHAWAASHYPVVRAAQLVSDVARPVTFELISAATVAALLLSRRWRDAVQLATATVAGMAAGPALKALVRRPRPSLAEPLAHAHGWSFPSSHALTVATAMAAYLLVLGGLGVTPSTRRVLAVIGSALAVAVGASRVVLGVHYLSDVLAGLLLGVALTCTSFELWRSPSTSAVSGGASARFQSRWTNSTQQR